MAITQKLGVTRRHETIPTGPASPPGSERDPYQTNTYLVDYTPSGRPVVVKEVFLTEDSAESGQPDQARILGYFKRDGLNPVSRRDEVIIGDREEVSDRDRKAVQELIPET